MSSRTGFCTIPCMYVETHGVPIWRLKSDLTGRGMTPDEVEECLAIIDKSPDKDIVVIPSEEPADWQVYAKADFFEVIDVE